MTEPDSKPSQGPPYYTWTYGEALVIASTGAFSMKVPKGWVAQTQVGNAVISVMNFDFPNFEMPDRNVTTIGVEIESFADTADVKTYLSHWERAQRARYARHIGMDPRDSLSEPFPAAVGRWRGVGFDMPSDGLMRQIAVQIAETDVLWISQSFADSTRDATAESIIDSIELLHRRGRPDRPTAASCARSFLDATKPMVQAYLQTSYWFVKGIASWRLESQTTLILRGPYR